MTPATTMNGFRPVHDAHAIEQLVATVQFDRPLSDELIDSANGVMGQFRDAMPARNDLRGMGFQIGPGGLMPVLPSASDKPSGVIRTLSDPRGIVVKELRLDRQSLVFRTQIYTRWLSVWEETRRYFEALLPLFLEVNVAAYGLTYVDKFIWSGPLVHCRPSALLAADSPYVTARTFDSEDLWHCHSGKFLRSSSIVKRLEVVDIDCLDENVEGEPQRVIRISTAMTELLNQPGYTACQLTAAEAPGEFRLRFPTLHDELKRVFSEIICNDLAVRVRLNANTRI